MKNLGLKNNTKDIANLEDIKTPSNMVTTNSVQTISGAKTFTKTTTFQNDIKANGSAGTSGQVLISQGSGNSPKWGDVPAPSNVVTTNTAQTITGAKTFSNDVAIGIPVNGNGLYVAQGDEAGGDWYFQVNDAGVSIDPDTHGIPLLVNGGDAGLPGYYLMSEGIGQSPSWSKIATVYDVSNVRAYVSTNTYQIYNSATYSSTGTLVTPEYLHISGYNISNTADSRIICCIKYTSQVAAGKWVKIQTLPFTPTNAIATPYRATTESSGPQLVTAISGKTVYVGVNNHLTGGFYLILMA